MYRAWATANAFAAAGWDVTVLTVPRETFTMSTGVDESLERTVDPSIEIVRVPFHAAAFENDLRNWSRTRATIPEIWNVINARKNWRSFPEHTYGGWRSELESAALAVHARHPVDIVLGSANPHVDFTPGWALYTKFGVPYVMDYRDAWQLDVFTGARLSAPNGAVAKWERQLITHAHAVWFVNDPILQWHADLYPDDADKFHVVANGYDAAPEESVVKDDDEGLVFGYIGTISASVPIESLVEGWKRARERSPLLAKARMELWGHLNHVGPPNEAVARQLSVFANHAIAYRGPVPKREIDRVYANFDALLLVLGTGRYVTSGKVYEYAATGLPIVSVHDPINAATEVLRDAPAWYPVKDLTPDSIASALIDAAEAAQSQTGEDRLAGRAWAEQFQRARQLDPQIAALRSTVEGAKQQ
ncbi:glycosyltransferase [Microbacterium sp. NPDC057659]|uniref:glycosyltransferase n=1 Tax=Microbacterium sp. NPDC057659 TaxID=3346198 RepID=UPI00366D5C0B